MIKRLMIVCFVLMTFSAIAEDKVMEQQGKWSIIRQDNWYKPLYILTTKNKINQLQLVCDIDSRRMIFKIYYFKVKKLNSISLKKDISIQFDNQKIGQYFAGTIFNYKENAIFWANNLYYANSSKNFRTEKAKLLPILSQLFKQFLTASGDITFTAQGEGDTVYQATISSDGLPTMFNHFAQYCGPDFIEAFDLAMDEK